MTKFRRYGAFKKERLSGKVGRSSIKLQNKRSFLNAMQ